MPRSDSSVVNGMLTILIDPRHLGTTDVFARDSGAFLAWLRQSRTGDGVDRVRIPGEPERESRARRGAEGVPVDAATWSEIGAAAARVGVARAALDALARES